MRKVLVVEDNPLERAMLTNMLSDSYSILVAANGEEMVAILRRQGRAISAVLLDIVMPGMGGYEALRIIRNHAAWTHIPVIVTTAFTDGEAQLKAMRLGANGFASKPYNIELLLYILQNAIDLQEKSVLLHAMRSDPLTGLLNRESFIEAVDDAIHRQEPGYYMLSCIDIESFKVINDQYGTEKGDAVLKHIAKYVAYCAKTLGGVCCRFASDKFGLLYPARFKDSEETRSLLQRASIPACINRKIKVRIGRYPVVDLSVPVNAMCDRATLAEESIRDRYDSYIAEYTTSMRDNMLHEQRIVNDMDAALAAGQFEPWFQPQYNHATGALIGAEALARWRKDGELIPSDAFIGIFERNGFIYKMDQYIWRQVCIQLRRWLDDGKSPLPVSVNISRFDIYQSDFLAVICGLVAEYALPVELLRLEVTESAFAEASKMVSQTVNQLIERGFTVEIDDFGSAYSSLNTLKDVPASILKLDMKFFENTVNTQRSGNIIESVVRMAKWLGMSVIAEGVEDRAQADYLKSIGCHYIQGYYYGRPMPLQAYEALQDRREKETEMSRLETVENLDNNAFWDPRSMETLIFNSYVGAACIFEYCNGKMELLRTNAQYARELGHFFPSNEPPFQTDPIQFLNDEEKAKLLAGVEKAIGTNQEAACELRLTDMSCADGRTGYFRLTLRVIASAGSRHLLYCVALNMTELRRAEQNEIISAQRLQVIMDNIRGGVTAVVIEGEIPRMLFANDRYYRMLGYTKAQFEEELPSAFDAIHPEDRARVIAETTEASRTRHSFSTSYRVRIRNGGVRWMQSSVSMTALPGVSEPVQLAVATDITKEKEDAHKMDELLNAIPGGVVIYRVGDAIETLYSSDGVAKLTGIDESEYEAWQAGDIISNAIYEDDAPAIREKIWAAVASDSPVNMTFRLKHKNGSMVWVDFSASMIREDGAGKIYYGIFTKPAAEAALYRSLAEDSPAASIILEKQNRKVLYANPAWRRMEGVSASTAILNVSLFELLPPESVYFTDAALYDLPSDRYTESYHVSSTGEKVTVYARSLLWNGVDAYVCYMTEIPSDTLQQMEAQEKLRLSEEENRLAIAHSRNVVCRYNMATKSLKVSPRINAIFGINAIVKDVPYGPVKEGKISPETADAYIDFYESILRGEKNCAVVYQRASSAGWRWIEGHASTIFADDGKPTSAVISFVDVTDNFEKDAAYKKWRQSLQSRAPGSYSLFHCNLSKNTSFDTEEGSLLTMDYKAESMTFDEQTKTYATRRVHAEDQPRYLALLQSAALLDFYKRGMRTHQLDFRECLSTGDFRWLRLTVELVESSHSSDAEAYLMYEDIDEEKRAELRTKWQAENDSLTGVLNRATFVQRFQSAVTASKPGQQHALLMLDLDDFKGINDTYGHDAGDYVLREMTKQIRSILRRDDLLGRIGGDEFLTLLMDIPDASAAEAKAKQICAFNVRMNDLRFVVKTSIGIAMIPRHGKDFDTLYRKVDAALYEVKKRGKGGYIFVGD